MVKNWELSNWDYREVLFLSHDQAGRFCLKTYTSTIRGSSECRVSTKRVENDIHVGTPY